MCHKLTILACDEAAHTIAQCEHGTIHIFWVRAAIFLLPSELVPLLLLLQQWQPQHEVTECGGYLIMRQADRQFQLWCHDTGLRMSEAEVYTLAQLLWQSAGQIDRFAEGQQLLTQQPELAMYRRLTSVPKRPECQN